MRELVSIILPVYNGEKNIQRTIKSVIDQTYDNWELIIIDDGSSDNTVRKCKEFQEDNRISYRYQENQGVLRARINGIQFAKGSFIVYLDADDILHKQFLEIMLNVYEKSLADIVMVTKYQLISKHGLFQNQEKYQIIQSYIIESVESIISSFCGEQKHIPAVWGKLYRKEIVLRSIDKMSTIPKIFIGEDMCMNLCIFIEAKNVALLNLRLYNYRYGGSSFKNILNKVEDIQALNKWRNQFIYENKLKESNYRMGIGHAKNLLKYYTRKNKDENILVKAYKNIIEDTQKYIELGDEEMQNIDIGKYHETLSVKIKQVILRSL